MTLLNSIVKLLPLFFLINSCSQNTNRAISQTPFEQELKTLWFDGQGEINTYKLKQARYGEMREGEAVLIFVTEDFSTKTMTKADHPDDQNIPVIKLNSTRKFLTGIYPYSMMNSTFFPFPNGENSIKVSTSSQEWCGHTYLELIDNGRFEIANHSYFQSEAQKDIKLKKALLEDDLWTMIRLNPEDLPQGEVQVIPSFFYLRFSHNEIKAYNAILSIKESESINELIINYPELERELRIQFEREFPFKILGWEDAYYSGWGEKRHKLTTSAELIKSVRTDYWTKNAVADSVWREEIGLDQSVFSQ